MLTVRPELAGLRLDRWLTEELPRLSRTRAHEICARLAYDPQGRPRRPSHRVAAGEVVVLFRPRWEEPPVPREVPVLWEDAHLLAVDKPAGLPVHPSARYFHNTLTAVLAARYPTERVVLGHRLDRETSGLLLAARTREAERALKRAFAERAVHKTYEALVHGVVTEDRFTVDAPVGYVGGAVGVRMGVLPLSAGALPAVTRFEVLERLQGFTRVVCHPETGRQHQLRVHLAHAGHPIVGDKLYAHGDAMFLACIQGDAPEEALRALLLPRQALHARAVALAHPVTREPLSLEAPLPEDLRAFGERHRVGGQR
ncbi:MAG: RluA family pseudouridine synthase [Deltaproteobacteria bacterium]|nr:RluA family pseudouridine synthase [Deltaproteobacteria bacterium]